MGTAAESLRFPIEELAQESEALLNAGGDMTPHFFGEKYLAANGSAPRYVWIPSGTVTRKEIATRTRDDFRPLVSSIERVEVHCWGQTYSQAWAMRCNALVAMKRLAQADLLLENGDWVRPSQGWNQAGEVYVLTCSLIVPTIDIVIPIVVGTAEQPAPLPEIPATSGIVPIAYETGVFVTGDPDVDGEEVIEEPA